jgi:hypothetical protein
VPDALDLTESQAEAIAGPKSKSRYAYSRQQQPAAAEPAAAVAEPPTIAADTYQTLVREMANWVGTQSLYIKCDDGAHVRINTGAVVDVEIGPALTPDGPSYRTFAGTRVVMYYINSNAPGERVPLAYCKTLSQRINKVSHHVMPVVDIALCPGGEPAAAKRVLERIVAPPVLAARAVAEAEPAAQDAGGLVIAGAADPKQAASTEHKPHRCVTLCLVRTSPCGCLLCCIILACGL